MLCHFATNPFKPLTTYTIHKQYHFPGLPVVRPKAEIRPFQHCGKIRPAVRPESAEIPPKYTFF